MRNRQNINQQVRDFFFSTLNKEFLIFLFFLVLSGIFWLMMTLNETYERQYDVPLCLTGVPRNTIMTDPLPDTVHVTIRDKGFTLITYYGRRFKPVTVKFDTYANDDKCMGSVPQQEVQRQIQAQLYGSSRLLALKPKQYTFYFTYGQSKKVPVVFKGRITTSASYYLAHTEIYPPQVTVYANKQQLEQLERVEIVPFNYRNLQDTIHSMVRLQHIQGVKMVPAQVKLSVFPDVLTEETVEVPVQAVNMPSGMVLRTFPSKVTVRFTVGASLFRTIKPELFHVVVDYNELKSTPSDKCTLQLRGVPRTVSKARLDMQRVDYLLEQQ